MKKYLKQFFVLVFVVSAFSGCSKEDESTLSPDDVAGTYYLKQSDKEYYYYIEKDMTGSGSENYKDGTIVTDINFYYTIKGNKIKCSGAYVKTWANGDDGGNGSWDREFTYSNGSISYDSFVFKKISK